MFITCELLNECKPKDKIEVLNTGLIFRDTTPIVLCDEVGVPVANIKDYSELMKIIEKGYFESDIKYSENEYIKYRIIHVEY